MILYSLEIAVFFRHSLVAEVGLYILVATPADSKHDQIVGLESQFLQGCDGVCTFDGRYDTLHASQFIATVDSLVVVDAEHFRTAFLRHVTMPGTNAGVVEAGLDCKGLLYLTILILHDKHLRTMQDTCYPLVDGSSRVVCLPTVSARLC